MKRIPHFVVASFLCFSLASLAQTDCSTWNGPKGPIPYSNFNTLQHTTQNHNWLNTMKGSCSYSGTGQTSVPTLCTVHSTANSNSYGVENGITAPYWHEISYSDAQGVADGGGGATVTTDAEGAFAVATCAVLPCGIASITITGNGQGGGFTVSAPQAAWKDQQHYSNTCIAHALPPEQGQVCTPTSPPPYQLTPPQYWSWNTSTCSYQLINGQSPIIIDTKGIGFTFTDLTKGDYVTFDLKGDGSCKKFSWPKHGSGNAWLVLDRDGDGVIKDGTELFGNYTPHSDGGVPNYPTPNGFLALDWYDQPQQGGDGNLILDKRDAIWPKLKLWIDDHCYKTPNTPCQSLPQELYSLESQGVTSISMVWDVVGKMPAGTPAATNNGWTVYGPLGGPEDVVGNEYKFYTLLNPDAATIPVDEKGQSCCDLHQKSHDGRLAIDVYLKYIE